MDVVEKMESSLGRIVQRAVVNLVHMHHYSELADMWFSVDIEEQRLARCNEVCLDTYSTDIHHKFVCVFFTIPFGSFVEFYMYNMTC